MPRTRTKPSLSVVPDSPEPADILPGLAAAQAELGDKMVPWPDDFLEDLSPHAALLTLRQTAMATLKVVTGAVLSLQADPTDDGGPLTEVVNGVMAAVAGSTHSCVALGMLPLEAEQVGDSTAQLEPVRSQLPELAADATVAPSAEGDEVSRSDVPALAPTLGMCVLCFHDHYDPTAGKYVACDGCDCGGVASA
jgi:hypothetical protein